jgi:AcrR family transcriptional regulator
MAAPPRFRPGVRSRPEGDVNSDDIRTPRTLPDHVNDVNMPRMRTPAPARKQAYHHGDLRNALLAAALRLVARHGVEGFSLREAARAVGVSAAAAYRHFEDRSALLEALAHEGLAQLALGMEEAVASAPGAPTTAARAAAELTRIGTAYVEFAVAHPARFRVMFGPWCDLSEELAPELLPRGRDPLHVLVDTLDGMVRAGAITAAAREGAEVAAWSAVHGLASLLVDGGLLDDGDRARTCGVVLRMILLGLGVALEVAASAVDAASTGAPAARGRVAPKRRSGIPRRP